MPFGDILRRGVTPADRSTGLRPSRGPNIRAFIRMGISPDDPRPSELIKPTGENAFADFVAVNSAQLDSYAEVSRDVRSRKRELANGISSMVGRQLAAAKANLTDKDLAALNSVFQKKVFGFGGVEETHLDLLIRNRFPRLRSVIRSIDEIATTMAQREAQALNPAVENLNRLRGPLVSAIDGYLGSSFSNVADLDAFLIRNDFKLHKEVAGEFLADYSAIDAKAREKREETQLDRARKKWQGEAAGSYSPAIFARFWESIESKGGNTVQWVHFSGPIDSFMLRLSRKPLADWPDDLREKYLLFASREVDQTFARIVHNLHARYPSAGEKSKAHLEILTPEGDSTKRKNRPAVSVVGPDVQYDTGKLVVEQTQVDYTVTELKVDVSDIFNSHYFLDVGSGDEGIITNLARRAATSPQMATDLANVIHAMKKVRFGDNFRTNTTHYSVTVGGKSMPLWEIDPGDFADIRFNDPATKDMRMVVAVDKNLIMVEGIYTHSEFDKRMNNKSS